MAQATEEEEPGEVQGNEVAEEPFAEEIIVTARKREEDVQDVPVAVSVVTAQTLEDTAASDITQLQAYVPNLSIYQGRNQSTTLTAFMRGIGQADPLWGVDPGVGLYLDDVYIARPQGALLDVYDVERVEVLRGPQGTLYGKNTIGGAIKYVSKQMTDTPTGHFSLTGGSHGTQEIRAGFSGPLVEGKLRAKVAFASLQRDGYGKNLLTGEDVSDKDTTAYRVALDWLPSDSVKVQLSYDQTEDTANPIGLTRLEGNPYCLLFTGVPCDPLPKLFDTQSGMPPTNGTDSNGTALTLTWDINDSWQLKSITAVRESDSLNNIDFDTTPLRISDAYAYYNDEQTTQEIQLVYDSGDRWDGVLGLYYFDGEAGGTVNTIFFESVFVTTNGYTKTKSYAAYLDANYRMTDNLSLNFGLRPTRETKNGRAFNVYNSDDTFTDITFVTADFDKEETFSSLAPRIGFDYSFSPDVMGYLSLSRGFKSGGFNVRAQATQFPESAEPFDDEVLTVAEIGLKSVLADRQLVLNTALFYGDYADIQVSTFASYDSDGDGADDAFFGNFVNAGAATMMGFELELDWSSASWFGLSGNLSYLDADPDTFLDADNDGFVDTQVITNAPELTGSIRLNVDFPAFGGLITGSVGYSYRDDSVLTNEGGPDPRDPTRPLLPLIQPSFSLLDAWVGWLSPQAKWRIGISGKNLTDEEYMTNGYNLPVLGVVQGSFAAPRTVTTTVEYRFF
jgi:iron complex outermembrane receptor protein